MKPEFSGPGSPSPDGWRAGAGANFFPQTRCFLSEEHAEFVRGAFEEGSQAFDPSPVRTVARSMVAMLARAAGGMGKLRTIVRSQDIVGLRTAL